jgi:glycosyltransferase involved in cell wall biosynthesis
VARRTIPDLVAVVLGDGPARPALDAEIARLALADVVETPGFVDQDTLHDLLATSAALVLPSSREGFGLVVVEANANGTPAVVVAGPGDRDNAAAELVEPGVNGFVAASTDPDDLGAAIVAAVEGGEELRASTLEWFARNRSERSMSASFAVIMRAYGLA